MFYYCKSLTKLNITNWDTSNVLNMYSMFFGCGGLTQLDLSGWNTSSVTNMENMFYNCKSLKELNLLNMNIIITVYSSLHFFLLSVNNLEKCTYYKYRSDFPGTLPRLFQFNWILLLRRLY